MVGWPGWHTHSWLNIWQLLRWIIVPENLLCWNLIYVWEFRKVHVQWKEPSLVCFLYSHTLPCHPFQFLWNWAHITFVCGRSCVIAVSPCFSCRGCRAGPGAASLHRLVGWSAVYFSCQKQGQRSTACVLFSSVLWPLSWQHAGCGYQQSLHIHWHVWVWKHGSAGVGCTNSSKCYHQRC